MPDTPTTDAGPAGLPDDPGGRWRLGLLSLLAVLLIGGGVLLFGLFGGGDPAPAATSAPASITIPPLPATARGEGAAPDFALDLFDGTRFSLARHLAEDGRPVILNLWASWCPPCRDEMPDLDAAAAAHPEVLILGVAIDDDPLAAEAFADEIAISYPAGYDETGSVERAYPSASIPVTFVISSEGMLLRTVFGRIDREEIEELVAVALAG